MFPYGQGGAINSQIAGKALCFELAARPDFEAYARQIVRNASVLAGTIADEGVRIVSGGTENHMFLMDLRSLDADLTGKAASALLDEHGVTLNRNAIPFDPRSPFITSGLRIGTSSVTTAGMKQEQMAALGRMIVEILRKREDDVALKQLGEQVAELAAEFPSYPEDFVGHV